MQLPPELKAKSERELEEWFLETLDSETPAVDLLLGVVGSLAAAGRIVRAEAWAEMAQDALAAKGPSYRDAVLRLLRMRLPWQMDGAAFRDVVNQAAQRAFSDRFGKALVASCGLEDGLPVAECLRRLDVLNRLAPDVLCHDKTWGFGVVRRMDDFYKKVTVDFTRKHAHPMSFAYAAETLELIGAEHLYARRHRDRPAVEKMVRDNPAEMVRIAIRSFGEMSVPAVKDVLVPDFLPEDDWKRFWDAARKELKADPLVEIPAKRNDPIRLLDRAKDFGSEWIRQLETERDPESILRLITELERENDVATLAPEVCAAVGARLSFVVLAARGNRADLVARCVLAAQRLGVTRPAGAAENDPRPDIVQLTESLLQPSEFLAAGARLPARELPAFIAHVTSVDAERAAALMLAVLPQMTMGLLSECMDWIVASGRHEAVAERIVGLLRSREVSGQILWWLCRQLGLVNSWEAIHLPEVMAAAVDFLASQQGADELKAQNQLRAMFEDGAWIGEVMQALDPAERRNLLTRVSQARTWEIGSRRSTMARMIKAEPSLQEAVSDRQSDAPAEGTAKRVTSWRSYLARQKQLKELVEVTIPANSRDIGIARSYGDLRENFEFQAAKDQQKLLMRRQAELERDLQDVRGTDFEGFTADRAGPGTVVQLARPDGRVERISILGEWDRDEALGVISSESRLAKLLEGARAGDTVLLPSGDGDAAAAHESCRVLEVSGLTAELKAWAAERPA